MGVLFFAPVNIEYFCNMEKDINKKNLSRKDFLKASTLAFAGGIISETTPVTPPTGNSFRLYNVRLETGFEWNEGEVIATKTDLYSVEIKEGKIGAVEKNGGAGLDAKQLLMLPVFKDMHIHLDKTFYGGPWQATRRRKDGVKGMIALEQKILPDMLKTSTERANQLIALLQSKGSGFARSHVNIEPTSGLQSLKNLQQALQTNKETFGAELVIFPQHGIFYTNTAPIMREAAQMDIDFIGGLDPYTIDGSIEKSIDFIVQLALDEKKGIDIHLHETGESGLKTVEYLIAKVNENPVLKGKTWLSHCFVLSRLDAKKQEAVAEKLGQAGVGIASTIPMGSMMPIPLLYKHKVDICAGNDSIIDHWNTWGTGSVLDKAKLMAQLYGYHTEFDLSRSLRLATHNVLPLDDTGKQQWPATGDEASFVLVNASCSAEAVSRVSPVESLVYKGKMVY